MTSIINNFELSIYLIKISDKTKIKKTYKNTLMVLNEKLLSIFEKVNK